MARLRRQEVGQLRERFVLGREEGGALFTIQLVYRYGFGNTLRDFQCAPGLIGSPDVCGGNQAQRGHRLLDIAARHTRMQGLVGSMQCPVLILGEELRSHQAELGGTAPPAPRGNVGAVSDPQRLVERRPRIGRPALDQKAVTLRGGELHLRACVSSVRTSGVQAALRMTGLALELQSLVQPVEGIEDRRQVVRAERARIERPGAQIRPVVVQVGCAAGQFRLGRGERGDGIVHERRAVEGGGVLQRPFGIRQFADL